MTPMRELIEHMEYFKANSAFARDCIKKAKSLIEEEKELITDSYVIGYGDAVREHVNGLDGIYQHSEDYYNSLTNPLTQKS